MRQATRVFLCVVSLFSCHAAAQLLLTKSAVYPNPDTLQEGESVFYDVQLSAAPSSTATVSFLTNTTRISVSPSELDFTAADWDVARRVELAAPEDSVVEPAGGEETVPVEVWYQDGANAAALETTLQISIQDNDFDQYLRHGALSWTGNTTAGRTVAVFHLTLSYHTSLQPDVTSGDVIHVPVTLNFNDGSQATNGLDVTVVEVSSDGYILTSAEVTHDFGSSTAASWEVTLSQCCRSGALLNNAGTTMLLQTTVDFSAGSGPHLATLPVVHWYKQRTAEFHVPATSASGTPLIFSLASSSDYGSGQAGPPPGLQLDPAAGRVTWDTDGLPTGLWSALVVVQDAVTDVKTMQELTLHLHASPTDAHPPVIQPFDATPTAVRYLSVSQAFSQGVTVVDDDTGNTLSLRGTAGLPDGWSLVEISTVDTGTSVTAMFELQWTPGSDDVGSHVVCLQAEDSQALTSVPQCLQVIVSSGAVNQLTLSATNTTLNLTTSGAGTVSLQTAGFDITTDSTIETMTVSLMHTVDAGEERLTYFSTSLSSVTASYYSDHTVVYVTGTALSTTYGTVLEGISYSNTAGHPTEGTREATVRVCTTGMCDFQLLYISVTTEATPPSVSLRSSASESCQVLFDTEVGPAYIAASGATVADSGGGISGMTITLHNATDGFAESLAVAYTSAEELPVPILVESAELNTDVDGSETVSHTLSVSESDQTVGQVVVIVDIKHSFVGDLKLELEHEGVTETLTLHPGGYTCSQYHLSPAVFFGTAGYTDVDSADGELPSLSKSGSSPGVCRYGSRGSFRPDGDFSAFVGTSSGGNWTLHVTDLVPESNGGRLVRWALVIHQDPDSTAALDGLLPPLSTSFDQLAEPMQNEILLDQGGRVKDASVAVQMVTTPLNDSDATPTLLLYHPDGTAVVLMEESTGCNMSSVGYFVFHDSGTPPSDICADRSATGELASVLKPSTSLAGLAGKAVNGKWRLVVETNFSVAVEMFSWSLQLAAEPDVGWVYNTTTQQLTVSGTDTADRYMEVLNAVTYNNSATSPDTTAQRYATVTVTNTDGLQGQEVTCFRIRHKPTVDLNGPDSGNDVSVTYTEDGGPVSIVAEDATLTASDLDTNMAYILAEVTNLEDGDLEVLSVQNVTSVEHVTVLGQTVSVDVIIAPVVHFTSGQLNISGLSSVNEYLQVLLTLTYNNMAEEPGASQRVIHVTANDGERESDVAHVTVTVTRVNDAPHFNDNERPSLSTQEDANKFSQVPITVLQFIGFDSIISDNDAGATQGIAIIGADNTHGQWDYLAFPGSYTEIADGVRQPDGTVYRNSTLTALSVVLKAEFMNFLRFIPDPDFNGESTISFVAWDISGDTSSYSSGDLINATYLGNTGAFSEEVVTVTLTVEPTNDAPTVDTSQVVALTPVLEDATDPPGDVISGLVDNCDDVDITWPGTQQNVGIAVTGVDSSNGQWQYSTDNGSTWLPLGSLSSSSAVLLGEDGGAARYRLRFLPDADFSGTAFLFYRAWDFTSGTAGDTGVSATYTSATGAFSQGEAIASITVLPSNDSPVVTDGVAMATITEDVSSDDNVGTSVSDMLAGHYTDEDAGDDVGVAVVSVDETHGDWQYTCDVTAPYSWVDFVGGYHLDYVVPPLPTLTRATLLMSACRIRFAPNANMNSDNMGSVPYMTILGWDNTESGLAAPASSGVNVTGYADSDQNEFSSEMRNVTIQVTAVNDPPELQLASSPVQAVFAEHGDPVAVIGEGFSLADVDNTELFRATISIDGDPLNNCSESSTSVEEVTVTLDGTDLAKTIVTMCPFHMTITPIASTGVSVSLEQFRTVLSTLHYANTYTNPSMLSRTVSVTVFDGSDVSEAASAHVTVEVTNDAPVLDSDTTFASITEDLQDVANSGTTVLALVQDIHTDGDSSYDVGIAVVGVDTRYGAWQWCCECDNATWQDMIGGMYYDYVVPPDPLPEKATLLSASCRIRFLPESGFNTVVDESGTPRDSRSRPYITIKAWDNTGTTTGLAGHFGQDTTVCSNVLTCEFSAEAVNATIEVLSVNDPPEISLPTGYSLSFTEDGEPISLLPNSFHVSDRDGINLKKVSIILTNSTNDEGFLINATSAENVTINDSENVATVQGANDEHIAFNGTSEMTLEAAANSSAVSIEAYVTLLRFVTYYNNQPEPDNATRVVRICADDGRDTTCEDLSISIVLVGDNVPVLSVGSYNFTFIEGGAEVSVVDPDSLTLSDDDNNDYFFMSGAVVTIQSLSPDMETLSVDTSNTSLTAQFDAMAGTLTVTGRASVQTYQEVLRTLTYRHDGLEPQPGPRTITYYVTDTDGHSSNAEVASVVVEVINDCAPVLVTGGSFVFTEGQGSPTSVGTNISLTDCDSGDFNMEAAVVWVEPAEDGAAESLSVSIVEGITVTYIPEDATLHLTGPASLGAFQRALTSLVYENTAEEPTPTARHVFMYASDGAHNSSVGNVTIEIRLVNDPPAVDLNGDVTSGSDVIAVYREGSGAMTIASSLSLSDNDNTLLTYANVTLVNNPDHGYETVTVDTLSTSLTGTYVDANQSSIHVYGEDTVENYAAVLRTVSYTNTHGDPDPQQRLVEFVMSDGRAVSHTGTAYIIFETHNDAPTLSSVNTAVTFAEEGAPVAVSPSVTVSDVDSTILASATVSITNLIDLGSEILNISTSSSLFSAYNETSGVLYISGVAPVEDYQASLQSVAYQNTEDEPSTEPRVLAYSCSDGITESTTLNITVNITARNDPPAILLANGTSQYFGLFIEDFVPTPIVDSNMTVTDEDSPFLSEVFINVTNVAEENFEGVFLDLSYLPNSVMFDQIQYSQILQYNSTVCSVDSVYSSIQLQGAFTTVQARELLLVARYCTAHDDPTEGERVIDVIVTDDQGEPSLVTTALITVVRVNDPPRLVSEPITTSFTTPEDTDLPITAFSLFYDPEEQLETSAVNIMSYPTSGALTVTSEGDLLYSPAMHDVGQYDLTYRVCDTLNACSDTVSLTIEVLSVNDPPEPVLPLLITTQEDTPVSTDLKSFVQDVEDDANGNQDFPNVTITSLPTVGSAEFSSQYRVMNFTPALNYYGDEYIGVRFCDNDGACVEDTITITVNPVNDPPSLTVESGQDQADPIQTLEDVSTTVQIVVSDVEQRAAFSVITNDTLHGAAVHNSTSLVETLTEDTGNSFNTLYTVSTHITYSPDKDYVGEDRVVFYVCDSGGECAQGVFYIQVLSENDPPRVVTTTVYTEEDTPLVIRLPGGLNITDAEDALSSSDIQVTQNVSLGLLTYNADDDLVYTPPVHFYSTNPDDVTFEIRVCDRDAVQLCTGALVQIAVSPVNDAPVAPPQYVTMYEDSAHTVDLGAVLTDTEDVNVTVDLVSLTEPFPSLFTASYDNQTGLVHIAANPDRHGKDLLHYQACDSSGLCNLDGMVVVTILEVNDPPVAYPFDVFASEDVTSIIDVGEHYGDLETSDISSLSLRLVKPASGTGETEVTYVTEMTSERGGELEAISSLGMVQYKPPAGHVGEDSFVYAVCDSCDQREDRLAGGYVREIPSCQRQLEVNQGDEYDSSGTHIACSLSTVTIYVLNTNDAPVVSAFSIVTSRYNVASINPMDGFQTGTYTTEDMSVYDPDDVQAQELLDNGQNLTFYQMIDAADLNTTTLAITSQPTKGTATVDRSSALPAITFTPRLNESGYDSFMFQLCDKNTLYKSSRCGGNVARVLITAPSPYMVNVTAFPGRDGDDIHSDSRYSSGDFLRVVFNEDTNMPPYGQTGSTITASELHEMFTFSTNLTAASNSGAFTGMWLNPRELEITVLDEGYPQEEPMIGDWAVSVKPVAPCSGFNVTTHEPLVEGQWSRYCLLNAAKDSAHANCTSPPLVGSWGLRMPALTTIVVRNDLVSIDILREQPAYFGRGSQLVLSLQPALSYRQLQLFCQQNAQNIVTMETFSTVTSMEKISCVNRDADSDEAVSVRRRSVGQGRAARDTQGTNLPEFTELVLEVEETTSASAIEEDAFVRMVKAAFDQESLATVLATSTGAEPQDFVTYTAEVQDSLGEPSLYMEQISAKTPQVISVVAADADNGDSYWSNGDTLTITFDSDTDTPPVATETEISRIMTFDPPLGTSYAGQWVTSSVLVITVDDASHPDRDANNVDNITFTFMENVLATGQVFTNPYLYGVPSNNPHCVGTQVCGWNASSGSVGICSADQLSCRARGTYVITSGNFGQPNRSLDWWYYVIICAATILTCCTLGIVVYLRQRKRAKKPADPPSERKIYRVTRPRLRKKSEPITSSDKALTSSPQGGVATPQTATLNSVLVNSRHAPIPVDNIMQRNDLRDDLRQPTEPRMLTQPGDLRQRTEPRLVSQPVPSYGGRNSVDGVSTANSFNQPRISSSHTTNLYSASQPHGLHFGTNVGESGLNVPGPPTPASRLASSQVVERSTSIDMATERRRRPVRRRHRSQIPRISELPGPLEADPPGPDPPPPHDDPAVGPLLKRASSNSIYSLATVNLGFDGEERRPGSSGSEGVGPRSFLTTDSEAGLAIRTHVYPRMDSDQSLKSDRSGRKAVSKKHKRVAPVSATTPYNTRTPALGTGTLKPRPVTPDSSRPSSSSSNSSPAPQLRRLAVASHLLNSNKMDTPTSSQA